MRNDQPEANLNGSSGQNDKRLLDTFCVAGIPTCESSSGSNRTASPEASKVLIDRQNRVWSSKPGLVQGPSTNCLKNLLIETVDFA
mmetsp:Transcript_27935/g.43589  ORF Transcript_27935/g.43589 Transcript_27935/m.43589 type:complete len:86 (-) Transcript_27935:1167-1424(-)